MRAFRWVRERAWFLILGVAGVCIVSFETRAVLGGPPADEDRAGEPRTGHAQPVFAEGRVAPRPGSAVWISAEIDGRLIELPFEEGDIVSVGDVLARLSGDGEHAALAEARARVAEVDVAIEGADTEVRRFERLLEGAAIAAAQYDQAAQSMRELVAHRRSLRATAERLEVSVNATVIVSPIEGVVVERPVAAFEVVTAGTRILRIVDAHRLWVEAEVVEYDIPRVVLGQRATVGAEGSPDVLTGRVVEIPASVNDRRIRPEIAGRPTDARVLLVKVEVEGPVGFRIGQRVDVRIFAP